VTRISLNALTALTATMTETIETRLDRWLRHTGPQTQVYRPPTGEVPPRGSLRRCIGMQSRWATESRVGTTLHTVVACEWVVDRPETVSGRRSASGYIS
jgi:hypothetical protein